MIDRHPIGPIQIREIDEAGDYHRRVILPGADISAEPAEVQAACADHWTAERVAVWKSAQSLAS
ncbi:hypothetical protein DKG74_07210 [Zavarzinia aquatilis]|uniref:Uncharacterized protein n=2 Tax=Zavarzinia aquatilis TaxID=2211142 RepID=A0A317EE95_9PROT|nr:hypothetical protein DKG74_07210 [Zavarzinia aquatilis]